MNELFEGCNHNCDECVCCEDCGYANNLIPHIDMEHDWFIKDMVEEEVWNKDNLQFEKKFVYEDKQKYWRKPYRKRNIQNA